MSSSAYLAPVSARDHLFGSPIDSHRHPVGSSSSTRLPAATRTGSGVPPRTPLISDDDDDDWLPSVSAYLLGLPTPARRKPVIASGLFKASKTSHGVRRPKDDERTSDWAAEMERRKKVTEAKKAASDKQQANLAGPSRSTRDLVGDDGIPMAPSRRHLKPAVDEQDFSWMLAEVPQRARRRSQELIQKKEQDRHAASKRIAATSVFPNNSIMSKSSTIFLVDPAQPLKPAAKIDSIADILKRHQGAITKAESALREKLRLGIPLDAPAAALQPSGISTISNPSPNSPVHSSHSAKSKKEAPAVPARSSSSPGARVTPRSSSRTELLENILTQSLSGSSSDTVARMDRGAPRMIPSSPIGIIPNSAEKKSFSWAHAGGNPPETPYAPPQRSFYHPGLALRSNATPASPPKPRSLPPPPRKPPPPTPEHQMAVYLRLPNLNKTLHLPRPYPQRPLTVSVAEVGPADGYPVLISFGLGCVRYLIALFEGLAEAFGLRLICIDRWGIGKTDQVSDEMRNPVEWARVVERALGELHIDKFALLGHSAGAVYAGAIAIRLAGRVRGRLHLLTPWLGVDVDDRYKWLQWMPNGVIKGALGVEWKIQSYLLGKPPPLQYRPVEYNANLQIADDETEEEVERPSRLSDDYCSRSAVSLSPGRPRRITKRASAGFGSKGASFIETMGRSPRLKNLKSMATMRSKSDNADHVIKNGSPGQPSLSLGSVDTGSSISDAGLPRTPAPDECASSEAANLEFGLGEGFDSFNTDLRLALTASDMLLAASTATPAPKLPLLSSSSTPSKVPTPSDPKPDLGPAFAHALQQASHAESEPGTTSDLLTIVLNRSNRPWGFTYEDIPQRCLVWYGREDDKISEAGMRWLAERLHGCELRIVEGEGHNLMSCAKVMCEVFESLGKEAEESGRARR